MRAMDSGRQLVAVERAMIGLLGPGSERTWQVRVPDRQSITNSRRDVESAWR
jgi:hypothetical protein